MNSDGSLPTAILISLIILVLGIAIGSGSTNSSWERDVKTKLFYIDNSGYRCNVMETIKETNK